MTMQHAVRQVGDVTVLDLSGRINFEISRVFQSWTAVVIASRDEALPLGPGRAPILHDVVCEQITAGRKKILLNLRNVTYIDSSGLGELVACMTTVRNRGSRLRICNVDVRVYDLLRMTRLDSVLNLEKDEATALRAFANEKVALQFPV
jgi:anti-sigma B factor antagonist